MTDIKTDIKTDMMDRSDSTMSHIKLSAPPAYNQTVVYEEEQDFEREQEQEQGQEFVHPAHRISKSLQRLSVGKLLTNPVLVPQTTNIFHVKHLTPFARCYPPALGELPNPITQDEFLVFVDCLNDVFVAQPALLATAMAGGMLMGTQILPAQIAGGAVQVAAISTSALITFYRVRRYMLEVNKTMFEPRGLKAVIMGTKKMMAEVGYNGEVDAKGKLVLPALSEDPNEKEDPRSRRIRAFDGFVSPLNFDVPEQPMPVGTIKQMIKAPNRFQNQFHLKRLVKAREKALKDWRAKMTEVEAESARIPELQQRITDIRAEGDQKIQAAKSIADQRRIETNVYSMLAELEADLAIEKQARATKLEELNSRPDKKKAKMNKKEAKLANRILWIVIKPTDHDLRDVVDVGASDDESVVVASPGRASR